MGEDDDICPECRRVRRDVEGQYSLGQYIGMMCGDCADSYRPSGTELGPDYLREEVDPLLDN